MFKSIDTPTQQLVSQQGQAHALAQGQAVQQFLRHQPTQSPMLPCLSPLNKAHHQAEAWPLEMFKKSTPAIPKRKTNLLSFSKLQLSLPHSCSHQHFLILNQRHPGANFTREC